MTRGTLPSKKNWIAGPLPWAILALLVAFIPVRGSAPLGQVAALVPSSFVAGLLAGWVIRTFGLLGGPLRLLLIAMATLFITSVIPAAILRARLSEASNWIYIWAHLSALFAASLIFPVRRRDKELGKHVE